MRELGQRSETALGPITLCLAGTTPAFVWVSAQEADGLAFPCDPYCQHWDDFV